MSTEKSVKQIEEYLRDLDKNKDYPASFSEFIKELTQEYLYLYVYKKKMVKYQQKITNLVTY